MFSTWTQANRADQKKAFHPLLLMFALAVFLASAVYADADTVLIANPAIPEDTLTRSNARLLFSLRRTHWSDGHQAHVFVLKDDNPVHRAFVRQVLQLYPRQLRRVWDRQTYSGTGQAPETVTSPKEMKRKIATTPGSVGYLPKDMVDESVKLIEVH